MSNGEIIGLIGGALTTGSFVPQVIKVLRLKSAREISLSFNLLLIAGLMCWIVYGIWFNLLAAILWNAVTLALALVLLGAKLRYGRSIP